MAITTFNELKTEIARWARRNDLATVIDDAIAFAEEDMRHGNKLYGVEPLRVKELESLQSIECTAETDTAPLPARCLSVMEAYFDASNAVSILPPARMREVSIDGGATPRYGFVVGEELYLSPTPSSALTLYARCMVFPLGLSGSNTTNVILTNHPNIYMQGVLTYVFAYTRNDAEEAKAAKRFAGLVAAANRATEKLKLTGTQAPAQPYRRSIP